MEACIADKSRGAVANYIARNGTNILASASVGIAELTRGAVLDVAAKSRRDNADVLRVAVLAGRALARTVAARRPGDTDPVPSITNLPRRAICVIGTTHGAGLTNMSGHVALLVTGAVAVTLAIAWLDCLANAVGEVAHMAGRACSVGITARGADSLASLRWYITSIAPGAVTIAAAEERRVDANIMFAGLALRAAVVCLAANSQRNTNLEVVAKVADRAVGANHAAGSSRNTCFAAAVTNLIIRTVFPVLADSGEDSADALVIAALSKGAFCA